MSTQLDILALEPFFGGVRRHILEAMVRYSRHRWTVLKLPPRRIERRLSAAANWFSEQLSRHWVGRVDLLFTSEAMNLASLFRLMPPLAKHPSVVYFHDNQLPDLSSFRDDPLDLVNLNTATAATELWFNSGYHKRTFMIRAAALVDRHPELSSRSPIPSISAKSRLMPPPIDLSPVHEIQTNEKIARNPRTLFVETREADIHLLNQAFAELRERAVNFSAVTLGPIKDLDPLVPRTTISEYDDVGQVRAMFSCGVVTSARTEAASDYQVLRALAAGCRPVLPDGGVYPELVPDALRKQCLYDISPEGLADRLAEAMDSSFWQMDGIRTSFKSYDAINACRAIDERVEQLVMQQSA